MKIRDGDLVALAQQGVFTVIIHGCNCFCTMGAGIARQIRAVYPEAYAADCATPRGDRAKLGTYSTATIAPGTRAASGLVVINAYTQFDFRGSRNVDYAAIERVLTRIATDYPSARIGYPQLGAGLAGGDWARIAPVFESAFHAHDHTLVRYVRQ